MRNIKETVAGFLSLPKEIALDLPLLTATGRNEVAIENYKNLIEFSEEKIRLQTSEGIVTVEGERLKLSQITTENVLVCGAIVSITYT